MITSYQQQCFDDIKRNNELVGSSYQYSDQVIDNAIELVNKLNDPRLIIRPILTGRIDLETDSDISDALGFPDEYVQHTEIEVYANQFIIYKFNAYQDIIDRIIKTF